MGTHFDSPSASKLHPTMKPVALIVAAIENHTAHGEVVFDPCGGSGSTLIAAHMLGRRAMLVELQPAYVDVIVKRWADHAGESAVNLTTGERWEAASIEGE